MKIFVLCRSVLVATAVAVIACAQIGKAEPPPSSTQPSADSNKPTSKTHPHDPMIWDVNQMLNEAVIQISRRYNLNKDQEEYTRLLMEKRVKQFLEQYESEVRELLQESINMRTGKTEGTTDSLKLWAMRAEPIYAAAKAAILEGNKEWSQILTPEQMGTYEKDRGLMEANFSGVTRQLALWKEGKGTIGPRVKQAGQVAPAPPPVRQYEPEDNWLAYVNTFIRTYHLDEKQAIAAKDKIHKEQFDLAKKYRVQNKEKFAEVQSQLKSPKRDRSIQDVLRRKRELEKPIRKIFVEMNDRLVALPDTQQKANVDPESLKQLETMFKSMAAEPPSAERRAQKEKASIKSTDKPSKATAEETIAASNPAEESAAKGKTDSKPARDGNSAKPEPMTASSQPGN